MHQIILYYKFHPIADAAQFFLEHRQRCQELQLKGRICIAHEGINGTLAGTPDQIENYKKFLHSIPGFQTTEFKDDSCPEMPFAKLIVRLRPEIVSLKALIPISLPEHPDNYLEPHEWRQTLESEKDHVLLDVRNQYESRIGHFDQAVTPPVENFFDFPQWLDGARLDKDKKYLIYCTGGIRCEKVSVLMRRNGFKKVYQLHGGIIHYAQKEGGRHFKGKCFVFDDRLAVSINKSSPEPITRCEITGAPCDTYINCARLDCNKLFICSREGAQKWQGCCSEECLRDPRCRPFDVDKIYVPSRKWNTYKSRNSAG